MIQTYSEILITEQTNNVIFKRLADRIISEFKAINIDQINDLDSIYWDFKIKSEIITLHQHTFIGISIFPKDLNNASKKANGIAAIVAFKLKYSDNNYDSWVKLKYGAEIEIQYLLKNIIEARSEKEKYTQRKFNESQYGLNGHEQCEICQVIISSDDIAYFGEMHSVCTDCYSEYIIVNDYLSRLEKIDKFVKLK